MFIINETVLTEKIPAEKQEALFADHKNWFMKHFQTGDFLIVGPYKDWAASGIMLAQADSREALEEILKGDVYYADKLAVYDVHEFIPVKIAKNICDFEGK